LTKNFHFLFRSKTNFGIRNGSGGSRGANPAMPPTEVGNGIWPPLGGRKNNESSVNFPKFKNFDPPIDVGHGFDPPCGETLHLKA